MSPQHRSRFSLLRRRLPILLAALIGIATATVASSAQAGDLYWDGCPPDFQAPVANSGGGYGTHSGNSAAYYTRPGCPWYLIDFTGVTSLAGRQMAFGGGWNLPQPSNQADCEALTAHYIVSRHLGFTIYEVMAQDTMSGEWADGFCSWRRASGNSDIVLTGSTNQYRLLIRAESHGAGAPVWGWGSFSAAP